jgi:hypothetical protein
MSLLTAECNPFDIVSSVISSTGSHRTIRTCHEGHFDPALEKIVQAYLKGAFPLTPIPLLLPECFAKAIFPWMGRILLVAHRLVSASAAALDILTDVSNLYLTTSFRLATGSAKSERLALGIDPPAPTISPVDVSLAGSRRATTAQGSSAMFGFGRRQGSPAPSVNSGPSTLPTTTDGEIGSPLPLEADDIKDVSAFILSAQDDLKGIAKLDLVDQWLLDSTPTASRNLAELACHSARVLEKRQLALWGCAILALTLEIAVAAMSTGDDGEGGTVASFTAHVRRLASVTPKLIEIGSRLSCIRAIRGRVIVQQVRLLGLSNFCAYPSLTNPMDCGGF